MTRQGRAAPSGGAIPSPVHPAATSASGARRHEFARDISTARDSFSAAVFTAGALDELTKRLIEVAVVHVTQRPFFVASHARFERSKGASHEQVMEAAWVPARVQAGGAFAHSVLPLGVHGNHEHGPGTRGAGDADVRLDLRQGGVASIVVT